MSDPRTPARSPSPASGEPLPPLLQVGPSLEFCLCVLGDAPLAAPLTLTMPSLGSPLQDALNRPRFPRYRLHSSLLAGSGEGLLRWRGPEGAEAGWLVPAPGLWRWYTPVVPDDITAVIRAGLNRSVTGGSLSFWINRPPAQGGTRPPSPPYRPCTDPDLCQAIRDALNETPQPAPQPAPTPVAADSEIHYQFQVFAGAQAVVHRKVQPSDPSTATSTEEQALAGVNFTVQFHRDDADGSEVQFQLQFSQDLHFHDPSLTGDAARQLPQAAQGSVAYNYVHVVNKVLSVVFQAQGSVGYSSQFDDSHRQGTLQLGAASSLGLNYKLNDWLTASASVQPGVTFGPGLNPDGMKFSPGNDTTMDFTTLVTLSVDLDQLGQVLRKKFRK